MGSQWKLKPNQRLASDRWRPMPNLARAGAPGLAMAALTAFGTWEESLNLIVGLWVAVSPWLVGFAANAIAMQTHLVIGILVAAVAAVRLWFAHGGTPRVTA